VERHAKPWPWSARLALCGCALGGTDALVGGAYGAIIAAGGLGATLGAVVGAGLDLVGLLASMLPRWGALAVWPAGLLAAALWLARALGAFARLSGRHAALAWAVLVAVGLGAIAGGAALASLQRTRGEPLGLAARLGPRWRRGVLALLGLGAVTLVVGDRRLYVDLYPVAHSALRVSTLGLLGVAAWFHWSWRPTARRRAALTAALLGVTVTTFATLHDAPKTTASVVSVPFGATWLGLLRAGTDFDGDGFSGFLSGGDLAPSDPSVGVVSFDDVQDPTLADIELYPGTGPAPTSVVFITVDTLRADHLGCYGYERETSPNLDAFAATSRRYTRAYTAGTWTSLAMSAAHRGLYPRRLRWARLLETNKYRLLRTNELSQMRENEKPHLWFGLPVDDPRPTLAERLQARGMKTLAVADDGFSQFFHPRLGAARGYDYYRLVDKLPKKKRNNVGTSDLAIRTLKKKLPADRPFFLWVHYFGAHKPDRTRKGIPTFGDTLVDRYDHTIRYADREVGRLLDALAEVRAERPLLTILTSDHGESLGRRRHHGTGISESQVRIPLFINGPGFEAGVDEQLASIVDIVPTVLAATETPIGAARFDGIDLAQPGPESRVVVAETWRYRADRAPALDLIAVMDGAEVLAYDRRRNVRRATRQGEQGHKHGRTVPTPGHLEEALQTYLEQTRGGEVDWED